MAVLGILRVGHVYTHPLLFTVLNLVFLSGVSLTISVLAARSFLAKESWAVLFLGMGALALALGAACAALKAGGPGVGDVPAVYNTSALLAGICHLTGVALGRRRTRERRRAGQAAALAAYLIVGLLVLMLVILIRAHMWPSAFVQGSGPTPFGLAVLWAAIVLFFVSAAGFAVSYRQDGSRFHYWYGLGLGLVVIGLVAVSLQKSLGDPLNWTGRVSQYLGGVYILIAIIPALKGSSASVLPLETALRESERRYQALFQLSPDAIVIDADGKYVFANDAAAKLFGADSVEELYGRPAFDMIHPDHRAPAEERARRVLAGEVGMPRRTTMLRLDGSSVDVDSVIAKVDFDGRPAVLRILHDVTERELAEEARVVSEQRYQQLFENMVDGYAQCRMIYDDEGLPVDFVYLAVNQAFGKLTGLDDVVGKPVTAVIPNIRETNPELLEVYGRVARGGEPERFEVALDSLDLVLSIAVYCPTPGYFVAVFEDITSRRRVEEALQHSEEQFRAMVDSSLDMVWVTDPEGYLRVVNRAYCEFFGVSPEDIQEHRRRPLGRSGDAPGAEAALLQAVQERRAYRAESQIRRVDGEWRWVDSHAGPRLSPDGEFLGHVGVSADISERVDAEKALQESEERLRQGQKMEAVGQLAGGIAHDFNNLLTAILGYSDLLLADQALADSSSGADLKEIKRAAERAGALTAQILAFSRRQALRPQVVSLGDVVDGMELLLRRTLGENIELVTRKDPGLGHVAADVHQFEQVIMNLALNGRDAMPSGGRLTIEVANSEMGEAYARAHPDVSPGSYVTLRVSDAGVGMDEATLVRVFEPFFTTKPVGQGTGMGLATVYGIVKQSGGDISVESTLRAGTTFTINLPRVSDGGVPERAVTRSSASNRGSESVIIVEDEISLRRLAERVLRQVGYRTLSFGSAEEALEVLEHEMLAMDLLLTDVMLTGTLQGNDLAAAARLARPDLPVLFMSGYSRDALTSAGRLDEGVNLLEKPFTPGSLANAVRSVLDRSQDST